MLCDERKVRFPLLKYSHMKIKTILVTIAVMGSSMAVFANATDPPTDNGEKNKKADILGMVINAESKKAIGEVSITAYRDSKKEKVLVTDCTGTYVFDELKAGVYKFVFEKTGYKKVTKDKVIIKTDEGFQMNIEMIEDNSFDLMPSPFHFSMD